MKIVIPLVTNETFSWFLEKTKISIVGVNYFVSENSFPIDIRKHFSGEVWKDVDLCITKPEILKTIYRQGNVLTHDIFVFSKNNLIGKSKDEKPKDQYEAILEIFNIANNFNNYIKQKQEKKIQSIERLIYYARQNTFKRDLKIDSFNPHAILQITPGASLEEIKKARNLRLNEYHPDKVANLGNKIKKVAEEETKKINLAYEKLIQK